jgi:hypothetical protein
MFRNLISNKAAVFGRRISDNKKATYAVAHFRDLRFKNLVDTLTSRSGRIPASNNRKSQKPKAKY